MNRKYKTTQISLFLFPDTSPTIRIKITYFENRSTTVKTSDILRIDGKPDIRTIDIIETDKEELGKDLINP